MARIAAAAKRQRRRARLRAGQCCTRRPTLLEKLFTGRMRSRITCTAEGCGAVSDTFGMFEDLSLEISSERCDSLADALSHFTAAERLCEGNEYRCAKCNHLSQATKQISVRQWPDLLCFHLKRFSAAGMAGFGAGLGASAWSGGGGGSSYYGGGGGGGGGYGAYGRQSSFSSFGPAKIDKMITYPEYFRVWQVDPREDTDSDCGDACEDDGEEEKEEKGEKPSSADAKCKRATQAGSWVYFRLYGMVLHHGSTQAYGHYTAVCRAQATEAFPQCDQKWVQFDDSRTNEVLSYRGGGGVGGGYHHHQQYQEVPLYLAQHEAYMLFYEREYEVCEADKARYTTFGERPADANEKEGKVAGPGKSLKVAKGGKGKDKGKGKSAAANPSEGKLFGDGSDDYPYARDNAEIGGIRV